MPEWTHLAVQALQDSGILLVEDGNHGEYRPRRDEFSSVGTAFIRAADMAHGRVLFSSASKVTEVALRRIRKGIGQPWDVLLSHKGTVGKVARVGASCPPFVCSPQTTFYRSLQHEVIDPRFLFYYLQSARFQRQLFSRKGETDMADYVSLSEQRRLIIDLPPIVEQQGIAEALGALDDKIDANTAIRRASRDLGLALLDQALERAGSEVTVGDLAKSLTRGVAPKYTDPGLGVPVLNQKCIRDGWASVEAARWMQEVPVSDAKKAHRHDVVVNSTGVGTLGRVARWLGRESIAVDGHVTVVRPDAARYSPVVFGYAMLAAHPHIEALGEGSTGQTELSRGRLAGLRIGVPSASEASQIATSLEMLDDHAESLLRESRALATLRDVLLPRLLSGELRVREAEELVGEAV